MTRLQSFDHHADDDLMAMVRGATYELTASFPPVRVGWGLSQARRNAGRREGEVAERLAISPRTLRQWESGAVVPTDRELHRLAEIYGCELIDLLPSRSVAAYSRASGTLQVGDETVEVDLEALDNDGVLVHYVALVRIQRGLTVQQPLQFRHMDIAALADALDLTDTELENRLVRIAGISLDEARWIRRQMLRRRVIVPVAGLGFLAASAFGLGGAAAARSQTDTPSVVVDEVPNSEHVPAENLGEVSTLVTHVSGSIDMSISPSTTTNTMTPEPTTPATTPVTSTTSAPRVASGNSRISRPAPATGSAVIGDSVVIEAPATTVGAPAAMAPPVIERPAGADSSSTASVGADGGMTTTPTDPRPATG